MEIDKILSVTLIILAIPVTISVVVLLARLLKVIFFHGEVNLEDVIFNPSKENDVLQYSLKVRSISFFQRLYKQFN